MIKVRCPSCSKTLNVPDKYAGKRAKCPACQGTVTIPVVLEEVVAEEDFAEEVVPVKPRKPAPRVADEDEEEEDRIAKKPVRRVRAVDADEEEEEEDRPRRKKRRKITRGEWADCPNCGASDATRIRYVFWGGFVAPLFINMVRCNECGVNYNGIHGDYNTTRITIYVVINVVLGLAIAALLISLEVMNS